MSNRKEIIYYLGLTFLITYCCWLIAAALTQFENYELFTPIIMVPYILGATAPMISSLFVSQRFSGKEEAKQFRKNIYNLRNPITAYLLIAILAWAVFFLPVLFGGSEKSHSLLIALQQLPIMIFFGGGLEEVGWRGFLQPRLQKKYSPLISTCMVGVIWTVWYLPLWLVKGSGQDTTNLLWFTLFVLSLSFLLSVIWNKYNSISLCILFHAACNSFFEVYPSNNKLIPSVLSLLISICFFFMFDQNDYFRK